MNFRYVFVALVLPLSACDTMHGANYSASIPVMPEQNCVANTLGKISGITDVSISVQRKEDRTKIAPRYMKTKHYAEVVDFSYENQRFMVESSGNDGEILARIAVNQIGACPSPERMNSFFKVQKDVVEALSTTCFMEAKFNKSTLSNKECPVE